MSLLSKINPLRDCREYDLSPWQCPQFLFIVMGVLICVASVIVYLIGTHYINDPVIVALIVLAFSAVFVIIDSIIVNSFERLAEANKMKAEFVSIVSHQLRSPISNLKWSVEFLMGGKLGQVTDKQTEYFKIIKDNTDRMSDLVSDLLVVSKIQASELPLKTEEFPLREVVEELVKEFKPFAQASNVEIKVDGSDSLVRGDREKVALVVENFLDNAIRYIRSSGSVEVSLREDGDFVFCKFKDDGVGIPEKDQKHIFQKFFRADNANKEKAEGSGLGLFIAKSIIERSGGKIGFTSKEGQGSTFWFKLPKTK